MSVGAETPPWQHFSGLAYFEHRWTCDPSLPVRYRQLLGEAGAEELMTRTINVAAESCHPFEFAAKVDIAFTYCSNLIVDARAFAGHPFDGHTLSE